MLCPWFLGGLGNSFLPWFWIYLRCKTRKGAQTMADKKNLCAQIDIALHNRVTEEKDRLEMTTSQYIASLLTEYYKMKDENGWVGVVDVDNGVLVQLFQGVPPLLQFLQNQLGTSGNHEVLLV